MKKSLFLSLLPALLAGLPLAGCQESAPAGSGGPESGATVQVDTAAATPARLPILGQVDIRPGGPGYPPDTVVAPIPPFRLVDQDGQVVTNRTLAGNAYVADFFFATCPGICPKMQGNLLKVYKQYRTDPRVAFLSHTIDPEHDSLPVLRDYAQRLGVTDARRWHFATAPQDTVFRLAKAYLSAALIDKNAPGGYDHSGALALVDDQGHVRGVYDGLNGAQVQKLLRELPVLLAEVQARRGLTSNGPAAAAKPKP